MKMISKIAGVGLGMAFISSSLFAQSLADAKKAIDAEQYQKAKTMLKNLVVTQADKDENFFYLGWVYLKQEYSDSAKAVFNKGLAVNAKSALLYAGLGAVAHVEKDNAGATNNFNQAVTLAAKNSKPYVYVGKAYLLPLFGGTAGPNGPKIAPADADAAIAVLNKGKVVNPKDPELLITLGDAYRSQLKSTEAYNNYSAALTLDPKSPVANVQEGVLWRFADNFEDAEKQFQAALAIDPNFGPAYRESAETYLRAARKDAATYDAKVKQAAEQYKKYIALTDNSPESQMRYADFLITAKDYVTLQQVATSLATQRNVNKRVKRYLATAAFENKDYPAAVAAMTQWVTEADPKRLLPSDYLTLGKAQMAMKNDSLGIGNIRKALAMDTSQVDLYGEIAKSLYAAGKYVEAGDAYHIYGQKSRLATLNDHYKEGSSYFLAFTDQVDRTAKEKTFKPDTSLLVKADSAFTYVNRKASTPVAEIVLQLAYVNDYKESDRNNIQGLAKPFYEQYIQLVLAKGNPTEKVKRNLANAYVYLATYAEFKEKDNAKALDFYNKAKENDPTNARVVYYFAQKGAGKSK